MHTPAPHKPPVSRSLGLALLTLTAFAPAAASAGNLMITIDDATINAKKLKGGDVRKTSPYSDLACLSLPGLRAMAGSCGVHLDKDGVTVLPTKPLPEEAPVDPMVKFELGDRVVRTYPIPSTLKPKWAYSFVLDEASLTSAKSATVSLQDYVSGDKETELGRATVTVAELGKPGKHKVTVGPATLNFTVTKLPDNASRRYQYSVPADKQIAELARDASTTQKGGGYVAVPVAEGEIVQIRATGQVQPNAKKYPDRKAGPDGIPTISSKVQFNQPGFRDGQNHAALIAQLGVTSMMVGASRKFTAETSGYLILAINDLKTSDNGGAFDVEVDVFAPASIPAPVKGAKGAAGPGSLDPRVVQQVVDSHVNELMECAGKVANPNGDIVLQFLIAADGKGICSVAECTPTLKDVGACMATRATGWMFPPPRGTAVVRYPLHLSVE